MPPAICPRCNEINSPGSKYCSKCAAILDIPTIMEHKNQKQSQQRMQDKTSEIMNLLLSNENIKRIIVEKLKEFNRTDLNHVVP